MKNKSLIVLVCIVICIVPVFYLIARASGAETAVIFYKNSYDGSRYYSCSVYKVVDGDTFDVRFKIWKDIVLEKRIRLLDVDTWELRGHERQKGLQAKEFIVDLVAKYRTAIYTDGSTGKYGRTLAKLLIIRDGHLVDVGGLLKDAGHIKTQNNH